jgi:hypothetical protein
MIQMKNLSGLLGVVALCGLALVPSEASAAPSITPAWWNCQPDMIFETAGELEVHCLNPFTTGLDWTAVNISSVGSAAAARFTSMAQAAILSGRRFRVFLTNNDCASAPSNCKYATSWSLYVP